MSTLVVADASAQAAGTLLGVLVGVVGLLPLLQAHAGLGWPPAWVALATLGGEAASTEQHPGHDGAAAVRAAVVGDERVVALQPPAVPVGPDRPLDHQQVRAARKRAMTRSPGRTRAPAGRGVRPRAAG